MTFRCRGFVQPVHLTHGHWEYSTCKLPPPPKVLTQSCKPSTSTHRLPLHRAHNTSAVAPAELIIICRLDLILVQALELLVAEHLLPHLAAQLLKVLVRPAPVLAGLQKKPV